MTKLLFSILVTVFGFSCFAQEDTTMLLTDKVVQIEATDAINDMYNFKFDQAEVYFLRIKALHPEHPMPYF